VIVGNNVLPARFLESQEQQSFIEKLAPYFRQAISSGEQLAFITKAAEIWFEHWPICPHNQDNSEVLHLATEGRTMVKLCLLHHLQLMLNPKLSAIEVRL
jgi:uncharacterized protein YoaH (UPF0181 family)